MSDGYQEVIDGIDEAIESYRLIISRKDERIAELEEVRATFKKVLLSIFQDGGLRHERLVQAGEALEKSDLLDD